jgi:hypothetical protein
MAVAASVFNPEVSEQGVGANAVAGADLIMQGALAEITTVQAAPSVGNSTFNAATVSAAAGAPIVGVNGSFAAQVFAQALGTDSIFARFLWEPVDDNQPDTWQNIPAHAGGPWQPVDDNQPDTWQDIHTHAGAPWQPVNISGANNWTDIETVE